MNALVTLVAPAFNQPDSGPHKHAQVGTHTQLLMVIIVRVSLNRAIRARACGYNIRMVECLNGVLVRVRRRDVFRLISRIYVMP